jgi:hypothetical protein
VNNALPVFIVGNTYRKVNKEFKGLAVLERTCAGNGYLAAKNPFQHGA